VFYAVVCNHVCEVTWPPVSLQHHQLNDVGTTKDRRNTLLRTPQIDQTND